MVRSRSTPSVFVLFVLVLSSARTVSSQYLSSDRIPLPADKTDADITLLLRPEPSKGARIHSLPLVNSKGAPLSARPFVANPVLTADTLQLHLSDLYFWGEAKLQFQAQPGALYTYTLQRGPTLASPDLQAATNEPTQLWLYNFDTQPLKARWRIVSGTDSVCGIESDGKPRRDCGSVSRWPEATIGSARSDAIEFVAPDSWFRGWPASGGDLRQAELELRFGSADTAPLLRFPLILHLRAKLSDVFPPWLATTWSLVLHLLWVTIWVTFGAVLLMLAQVMIPNFRKCLRMENGIEGLQERLRALGSRVSDSLYTRCHQELDCVRMGLGMPDAASKSRFFNWSRLALAGNTSEVNRFAGIVPRIESRIWLTERLDDRQTAVLHSDSDGVPPTLHWDRAEQLRNVNGILSCQFITEDDERRASASLDLLADEGASLRQFAAELEARIAGIRRQLSVDPWKAKSLSLIASLDGCADLITSDFRPVPDGGWNLDELILRDVAAIRLAIVCQMLALDALLTANPSVRDGVLKKLRSTDPAKLAGAKADLVKLSQGISEEDVTAALEAGMWDTYFEPITVTDQDVLRASFLFRNKDLNRCAAKDSFVCFWRICMPGDSDDVYERGWEAQFIPPAHSTIRVEPEIYDAAGNKVTIRSEANTDKGNLSFTVVESPSDPLHSRLWRGFLDATITALVPVMTVAITQVQNGGGLGIDKLVLLGFTSQAIRAAVVPEPASAPQPKQEPDTTARA